MSKGKNLTFYGLFDTVESIEIPILQRDYAQGREEEFEVRSLFLKSLSDALNVEACQTRQPLDLDFVYGNFEEGKHKVFSVLDGQQRLTTLFLLHWYLAVESGYLTAFRQRFVISGKCSRFTYKTRPSTTEFFDALTSRDIELSNRPISAQLKNSQWFYLSWQQDPTVQACLNMLDDIQALFSKASHDLYARLTNTSEPYITFQFLDLHSFGLSDELYIKMNARGKPLTVFENFKAKFEQKIKSFESSWPEYQLPFKDGSVEGYEYFIHKIDTDWADLFWPYRNTYSKDNTFDDELMNFFRLIIAYQHLLDNEGEPIELYTVGRTIFSKNGRLESLTLLKYEELGCLNKNLIIRLIEVLNLIYRNGLTDNSIQPYLSDSYHYSEESTFIKVITNSASYDDKLRFYAFYTYLSKVRTPDELAEWIRVIYNLTENTTINTSDDFNKVLFAIDDLAKSDEPILITLTNAIHIPGFTGALLLEEKVKAHLLLKSQSWRSAILEVERHPFFNGQIGFILNFAGILGFYQEYGHCDWNAELDIQYLNNFKRYAHSTSAIFRLIQASSSRINYLWERAVLSKGVYFTEKTGERYNLLSTRETKNNISRDHSWRRLLRIGSAVNEQKQEYVKAVIDDELFDSENIVASLNLICSSALENSDVESWRKTFIKHVELFSYCNQGFISRSEEEFILLSESQRNHYHSELYTKVLQLELSEDKGSVMPFSSVWYEAVKSRDDHAYADISGWIFEGHHFSLEVRKYSNYFQIKFKGGKASEYPEQLISVLIANGFKYLDSPLSSFGVEGEYVENSLSNTDRVKERIVNLCSSLMELCYE